MARSGSFFPLHSLGSFGTLSLSLSPAGGVRYKAVNSLEMPPSKCLLCSHGQKAAAEEEEKNATKSSFSSPFFRKCLFAPHTQGGEEKGKGKGGE